MEKHLLFQILILHWNFIWNFNLRVLLSLESGQKCISFILVQEHHVQKDELTNVWILCQLLITPICTRDFVSFRKLFGTLQVPRCHGHNLSITETDFIISHIFRTVMLTSVERWACEIIKQLFYKGRGTPLGIYIIRFVFFRVILQCNLTVITDIKIKNKLDV